MRKRNREAHARIQKHIVIGEIVLVAPENADIQTDVTGKRFRDARRVIKIAARGLTGSLST